MTNPSAPVHKGSISNGGSALLNFPSSVFVSGDYAYVTSSSNALEIINVSDPSTPTHAGSISNGGGVLLNNPVSVYVSGSYAYIVSTASNALEIVDVGNQAAPVHKGSITDGGGALLNYPTSVCVSGNYAYVVSYNSNSLEIINVSNPASPQHVSSIVDGYNGAKINGPESVFVSGNYAYVVSDNSNTLEIIDISNPASPKHITSLTDGDGGANLLYPESVFVVGNFAYVISYGQNALEIVHLKFPQTIPSLGLSASYAYGSSNLTLPANTDAGLPITYSSSNTSVAQIVNGNVLQFTGVGPVDITANQSGNSDYFSASKTASITVTKANQTITFSTIPNKPYGSAAFSLSATASSTLPVSYSSSNTNVATVSGSTVTIVGVGNTTITASQAGDANYNTANASQTFTVDKADQTITFGAVPNKPYGSAAFTLSATASSNLPVIYSSSNIAVATISGNTVTIVGAGNTTITASQAGDANYNAVSNNVSQLFTVDKANQTITFSTLPNKPYGSAAFTLSATASSTLPVTYSSSNTSVATISGNTVTIVGAGNTTITASQAGDANYNSATLSRTFIVDKASQTISFSALSPKTPGTAPFTLNATSSSGLPVSYTSSNPLVATITGQTVTIIGVGNTTITASQAGNANYNPAGDATQPLIVNKLDQTIAFGSLSSKAQGSQPFLLTASASSTLAITYSVVSGPATGSGSTLTLTGAGTVVVKASQSGNVTYNAATDVTQSFCVIPTAPSITSSFANTGAPVLTSSSASGNQWYLNGASIATATSATYTVTQAGSYTVAVTVGGCASVASSAQTIIVTEIQSNGEQEVMVYPNPVGESLIIHYSDAERVQSVSVIDMKGNGVLEGGNELINQKIDVSHYATGIYIVKVVTSSGAQVSKFLKK